MQSVDAILKAAKKILFAAEIDEKEQTYRDFCTALLTLIKQPAVYLISDKHQFVSPSQYQKIARLLKRLASNEPIELIEKKTTFNGKVFKVNRHTLIPRFESEILLNAAIDQIKYLVQSGRQNLRIADLGTGTGCLAICLALKLNALKSKEKIKRYQLIGTDLSAQALRVAKFNGQKLLGGIEAGSLSWLESDWFNQFDHSSHHWLEPASLDMIVSNPPYIAKDDPRVQPSTQFEPQRALFSEKNGFADIETIIQGAKKWLKPNGFLLLEHGLDQQQKIQSLLQSEKYHSIIDLKDQNQHYRVIIAQWQRF